MAIQRETVNSTKSPGIRIPPLNETPDRCDMKQLWITEQMLWAPRAVLSLSCSALYCLLGDLQHVQLALQLSQRQRGFNAL